MGGRGGGRERKRAAARSPPARRPPAAAAAAPAPPGSYKISPAILSLHNFIGKIGKQKENERDSRACVRIAFYDAVGVHAGPLAACLRCPPGLARPRRRRRWRRATRASARPAVRRTPPPRGQRVRAAAVAPSVPSSADAPCLTAGRRPAEQFRQDGRQRSLPIRLEATKLRKRAGMGLRPSLPPPPLCTPRERGLGMAARSPSVGGRAEKQQPAQPVAWGAPRRAASQLPARCSA